MADATSPSFADLLHRLVAREDLSVEQTRWAMDRVMSGEATPVQVAGFFIALRAKGESVGELAGLVDAMLRLGGWQRPWHHPHLHRTARQPAHDDDPSPPQL